jgi:hypothetical protein
MSIWYSSSSCASSVKRAFLLREREGARDQESLESDKQPNTDTLLTQESKKTMHGGVPSEGLPTPLQVFSSRHRVEETARLPNIVMADKEEGEEDSPVEPTH